MMYECNKNYKPISPFARECGSVDLPGEVSRNCEIKLVYVWADGASKVNFEIWAW